MLACNVAVTVSAICSVYWAEYFYRQSMILKLGFYRETNKRKERREKLGKKPIFC